jgi:hypothetical protein
VRCGSGKELVRGGPLPLSCRTCEVAGAGAGCGNGKAVLPCPGVGEVGVWTLGAACWSVKEARRGEGGSGDSRGSAAKVPFAASILKVIAGLIDRLLSAFVEGTVKLTGPTPSPAFWFWCLLTCRGAVPIDCEAETAAGPGPLLDRGLEALLSTLGRRLKAGSDGETGTGKESGALRAPGETDRAGRPSTDNSLERPVSRGVAMSDGPGDTAGGAWNS